MKKDEVCAHIRKIAVIPAIRVSSGDDAHFAAEAVTRGGIPIVEITMTVPGAMELISHLCSGGKLTVGGVRFLMLKLHRSVLTREHAS